MCDKYEISHLKRLTLMIKYNKKYLGKARRFPIGYSGTTQIHPKTALPFRQSLAHLIHPFLDQPHLPYTPKWHPDPLSRFATIHFRIWTDRRTDRPTDGIGDSCVPRVLTLYYIDNKRCVNNIVKC